MLVISAQTRLDRAIPETPTASRGPSIHSNNVYRSDYLQSNSRDSSSNGNRCAGRSGSGSSRGNDSGGFVGVRKSVGSSHDWVTGSGNLVGSIRSVLDRSAHVHM